MEVEVKRVASSDLGFVALPLHLIYMLQQSRPAIPPLLVLELTIAGRRGQSEVAKVPWFVAWAGASSQSGCIEVPEVLANCISLPDGARVAVRVRVDVPDAQAVHVEPASLEDCEILELNAGYLENHILNKVGVVQEGGRFPVVVPGQGMLTLFARSTSPSSVVKLVRGTEIVVALKKREVKADADAETPRSVWLRIQDCGFLHQGTGSEAAVIPTASVWISSSTATKVGLQAGKVVLLHKGCLPLVPPKTEKADETGTLPRDQTEDRKGEGAVNRRAATLPQEQTENQNGKGAVNRRAIVRVCLSADAAEGHVMITQPLRQFIGVRLRSGIYLQQCKESRARPPARLKLFPALSYSGPLTRLKFSPGPSFSAESESIRITEGTNKMQVSDNLELATGIFRSWLESELSMSAENLAGVPSAAETIISLVEAGNRRVDFLLSLGGGDEEGKLAIFFLRPELFLKPDDDKASATVYLERPQYLNLLLNEKDKRDLPSLESLWMKGLGGDALKRLKVLLSPINHRKLHKLVPGGVMIHGPHACGKTQLALALARELSEDSQFLAHWVLLKCGELSYKSKRALQEAVIEAVEHAPSLVIFDDLDALTPDEQGTEFTALAEYLSDLIWDAQLSAPIAFVATATGSLGGSLRSSGRFDCTIELTAPGVEERAGILKATVAGRGFGCSDSVASNIASRCEGYDANDLDTVVDRALHAAALRLLAYKRTKQSEERFELLVEDFNVALQGYTPSALKGIAKGGESLKLGWGDVGGLQDVCRILQELLELPVKFPKLFVNAPLRLRTGVLLYGPPGCGKTHIVAAAAAACSLRFVPVKGPELLDKYIGASEKAVRDIFVKASAAAPCILFFDEFDAIAPKRGHDNTGVTDRVVNQLLAELDGVSALNGVFVFAATNRPDLIDAALLRPGRLDHLLFCNFPSAHDRLDILRVLSRHLPMADDIDFEYLACQSEGFSGADIKAVLSDAELEAVHLAVEKSQAPLITMDLLKAALEKTIPLQEAERKRFTSIYNSFGGGRPSSKDLKGKMKATLA